jgi:hypothetical protein
VGASLSELRCYALAVCLTGSALCGIALLTAPTASGIVQRPVTVDGPSTAIVDFGGIAMASDGTGGLVYTKNVDGVPHVFASRYDRGGWTAPVRVDWDIPFDADQARIAAAPRGRLLVVWVTQAATVGGRIQRGVFSASLGPGASGFGPSLLVDPNVGAGTGVDPDVAMASPGKAVVAYRVLTNDFTTNGDPTAVQLRPGDVMADIRLARLNGDRWSRLGTLNRNPVASMRPPSPANAPKVGVAASGDAVVVWQEPDQTGTARIFVRRVFAASIGPPILVSPTSWDGQTVTGDADAFALDVNPLYQARIVSRVSAGGGLVAPRLFLGTLEPGYTEFGPQLNGPRLADGGAAPPPGPLGAPAVAAGGEGDGDLSMRLAFASGGGIRQLGADEDGALVGLDPLTAPVPAPAAEAVTAIDPEGGGTTAYQAFDARGRPAVAVRQEFPSGATQTGLLAGRTGGPVAQLRAGRGESGDALIGFRAGDPGAFEIVAARVSTPPARFSARAPGGWVRPGKALVRWQAAPSAVGDVRYSVLVDGRVVGQGMTRRRFRPRPAVLGSGIRRVRVLATDGFGGQLLTRAVALKVDSEPPTAAVRTKGTRVTVKLRDRHSGIRKATCFFGDGTSEKSRRSCHHTYQHAGVFTVAVRERDKAGNRIARLLKVRTR